MIAKYLGTIAGSEYWSSLTPHSTYISKTRNKKWWSYIFRIYIDQLLKIITWIFEPLFPLSAVKHWRVNDKSRIWFQLTINPGFDFLLKMIIMVVKGFPKLIQRRVIPAKKQCILRGECGIWQIKASISRENHNHQLYEWLQTPTPSHSLCNRNSKTPN